LSIHFTDYDAAEIERGVIGAAQTALGVDLGPGDERRIFLMAVVQFLVAAYAVIDDAARRNLLAYARGDALDAIGDGRGAPRLQAAPARAIFRFALSAPQAGVTLIPAGTRVTPDGALFFATDAALAIPAGQLAGDASATCLTPGAAGNGYEPGSVRIPVDLLPFVGAVSNLDTTHGGADIEADDAYRERVRLSPARFSVAGPAAAYDYHARSASADVRDVSVTTISPGEVLLTLLLPPEALPEDAIGAVYAACNARDVRPLTDLVTVRAAKPIPFDVDVTYYAPLDAEAVVVAAVEGPGGALDTYAEWQTSRIGRAINPDYLLMLLMQAGAIRADIEAPAYEELGPTQVASLANVTIAHETIDFDRGHP